MERWIHARGSTARFFHFSFFVLHNTETHWRWGTGCTNCDKLCLSLYNDLWKSLFLWRKLLCEQLCIMLYILTATGWQLEARKPLNNFIHQHLDRKHWIMKFVGWKMQSSVLGCMILQKDTYFPKDSKRSCVDKFMLLREATRYHALANGTSWSRSRAPWIGVWTTPRSWSPRSWPTAVAARSG